MKLKISFCVERGFNKSHCEDSALLDDVVCNDNKGELLIKSPTCICLCDGVGGNAGGKEASLFVCDALSRMEKRIESNDAFDLFKQVNNELLEYASKTDNKLMATTATGLLFGEERQLLFHIGNTRLYAMRGGFLQQLTKDQTTYQWLIDKGDEETAQNCNKSEIRGAFGGGRPDLFSTFTICTVFERNIPSILLLTSDGVHEYLNEDGLEAVLNDQSISGQEKVKRICEGALSNGSFDDRSAVLIQVLEK